MHVSRGKEKQPFSRTSLCLELLCIILLQSKRSQILLETNLDLATCSGWCEGSSPWWATQSLHKKNSQLKHGGEFWIPTSVSWDQTARFSSLGIWMLGFFVGLFCCFKNRILVLYVDILNISVTKSTASLPFPQENDKYYIQDGPSVFKGTKIEVLKQPSDLRSQTYWESIYSSKTTQFGLN